VIDRQFDLVRDQWPGTPFLQHPELRTGEVRYAEVQHFSFPVKGFKNFRHLRGIGKRIRSVDEQHIYPIGAKVLQGLFHRPADMSRRRVINMSSDKIKILLVDDEPDILEFMEYNLAKEGYEVFLAKNGKEAVEVAKRERPQLIILDIMMPTMDGIEACRQIREIPDLQQTLIAFLTARNEEYSQIAGFDVGADDYISKPVKPRILTSRIKALLRRVNGVQQPQVPVIQIGNLRIDREKYLVFKDDVALSFPRKEFELLALLTSKPGKVFSREDILSRVWGNDIIVGDRTIDVHIRKIREKLGDESIKTIKGIGYKFDI